MWLLDVIRRHPPGITLAEIREEWDTCYLNSQAGEHFDDDKRIKDKGLPRRTFCNHLLEISQIFGIDIVCDPTTYRYHIENPDLIEGDGFRSWLLASYSTLHQVQADKRMEGRILFENIPSGGKWLTMIADSIRRNRVLYLRHKGFDADMVNEFLIEPYCLKMSNRRWYVVGRSPHYGSFLTYALDRISNIEVAGEYFNRDESFYATDFFRGCCGVITLGEVQRVVVRAFGTGCDYVRSLPIHTSQREIESDVNTATFELFVRPNYELYQALLALGPQIEVLSPIAVRHRMRDYIDEMRSLYKDVP